MSKNGGREKNGCGLFMGSPALVGSSVLGSSREGSLNTFG